jgi:putative SOS response-associated peptidase YedK
MCNDYRLKADMTSIVDDFAGLQIKIRFPEGAPNIEARDDIKITDIAPIIRTVDGSQGEADLESSPATAELAAEQKTSLQFPVGGARVHVEPLPDRGGRILRVHRPG